jgi:hypothetical protein
MGRSLGQIQARGTADSAKRLTPDTTVSPLNKIHYHFGCAGARSGNGEE